MIRKLLPYGFSVTLLAGVASIAGSGPAHAYTGQQMSSQAKVTIAQARKIALSTQAGTITDEELERESGGSGLRYSFDIKGGSAIHEVGVDAQTGKVLENSIEGPNAD